MTSSGSLVPAQWVPRLASAAREHLSPVFTETGEDFDLFWTDPDLTALAADAAASLESVHHGTILPLAETGFVVFARPVEMASLVGPLGAETEVLHEFRAMAWQYSGNTFTVVTFADDGRRIRPLGHAIGYVDRESTYSGGLQPVPLFAALSLLITQKGVVVEETMKSPSAPPSRTKKGRTAQRRRQPDVRVVSIHPGTPNAQVYNEGDGRDATYRQRHHRWIVRGHWRQQPYPSLGEGVTKPIWIAAYVKGPEGAPLLTSPKVIAARAPRSS